MRRRHFLVGAAQCALVAPLLASCSSATEHDEQVRFERSPMASHTSNELLRQELVRYATLAPSSHNTQCWQFRSRNDGMTIEPDLSRRCPVVDPDDHHLFVSLGCAMENFAQAARANGLHANARFESAGSGMIAATLEPTPAYSSPLFQAIPSRQCTRADYDSKPLSGEELKLLEAAGTGSGVHLLLITDRSSIERVLEFVVAGNTAQMNDPAFVRELKEWIRFSTDDADRSGDGLYAIASGNPAMPRWLGSRMMNLFLTAKSENARYARQIRNSAGIAVFFSDVSDKEHWVEAGRCYERFALQATALGIRNAMLNQPVEVGTIRPRFASALGLGDHRPDLVVRFGRGPIMPFSMRRPVAAVMV